MGAVAAGNDPEAGKVNDVGAAAPPDNVGVIIEEPASPEDAIVNTRRPPVKRTEAYSQA